MELQTGHGGDAGIYITQKDTEANLRIILQKFS